METNVCPSRTLTEDDGDALDTVQWWLLSTRFDGMTGQPSGCPEWPRAGGLLNQDGKLVDAVELLRTEWNHLPHLTQRDEKKAR